jgi:hypothetical protein
VRSIGAAVLGIVLVVALGSPAGADGGLARGNRTPLAETARSYAAGEVCPFPVTVTFPVNQEFITFLTNDTGTVVGATITGKLVARVTNVASGATTDRILTGLGTLTFGSDGSETIEVGGTIGIAFKAGDSPANEWDVVTGSSVLHIAADGTRTLVSSDGAIEDLCVTLA